MDDHPCISTYRLTVMRIFVTAKPSSREEHIEKIDATHFIVAVKEPPVQGRANRAILKALAAHFGVPIARVSIIYGHTSRQKIIEVGQ